MIVQQCLRNKVRIIAPEACLKTMFSKGFGFCQQQVSVAGDGVSRDIGCQKRMRKELEQRRIQTGILVPGTAARRYLVSAFAGECADVDCDRTEGLEPGGLLGELPKQGEVAYWAVDHEATSGRFHRACFLLGRSERWGEAVPCGYTSPCRGAF